MNSFTKCLCQQCGGYTNHIRGSLVGTAGGVGTVGGLGAVVSETSAAGDTGKSGGVGAGAGLLVDAA